MQLAAMARPYPRQMDVFEKLAEPLTEWRAKRDLEKLQSGKFYQTETPFVVKRMDLKVDRGHTYHMVVTKKGGLLRWESDGKLAIELTDPAPLSGSGHDRFGFSSWSNDTYFDNLKITPR